MKHQRPRTSTLLTATLVLAATIPSIAFADGTLWSASPTGAQTQPNVVQVAVTYQGRSPAVGTVTVQAVVNGAVVTSYVPVSLLSGQTVVITVGFCGAVQSLKSVSATGTPLTTVSVIGDDMNPF